MNQKGVLFTLAVMLIGFTILGLYTLTQETSSIAEKQSANLNIITLVTNKESNIGNIFETTTHGNAIDIFERFLPISHNISGNQITITQNFPVEDFDVNIYFDTINMLKIFVSDTNSERVFDGTTVDMNAVMGPGWGGVSRAMNFVALPQCLRYRVVDTNTFWSSGNCTTDFNIFSMRLDITIYPQVTGEDLNSFTCVMDGNATCPFADLNALDPNPYFTLTVDDTNCAGCAFTNSVVKGHYNPSATNSILVSCVEVDAGVCDSQFIEIFLGDTSKVSRETTDQLTLAVDFTFSDEVKRLVLDDVNFLVEREDYNTSKRWIK